MYHGQSPPNISKGGFHGMPQATISYVDREALVLAAKARADARPILHADPMAVRNAEVPFDGWAAEKKKRVDVGVARVMEREWYDDNEEHMTPDERNHMNAVREHFALRRDRAKTPCALAAEVDHVDSHGQRVPLPFVHALAQQHGREGIAAGLDEVSQSHLGREAGVQKTPVSATAPFGVDPHTGRRHFEQDVEVSPLSQARSTRPSVSPASTAAEGPPPQTSIVAAAMAASQQQQEKVVAADVLGETGAAWPTYDNPAPGSRAAKDRPYAQRTATGGVVGSRVEPSAYPVAGRRSTRGPSMSTTMSGRAAEEPAPQRPSPSLSSPSASSRAVSNQTVGTHNSTGGRVGGSASLVLGAGLGSHARSAPRRPPGQAAQNTFAPGQWASNMEAIENLQGETNVGTFFRALAVRKMSTRMRTERIANGQPVPPVHMLDRSSRRELGLMGEEPSRSEGSTLGQQHQHQQQHEETAPQQVQENLRQDGFPQRRGSAAAGSNAWTPMAAA